jgi:hypothetical protein
MILLGKSGLKKMMQYVEYQKGGFRDNKSLRLLHQLDENDRNSTSPTPRVVPRACVAEITKDFRLIFAVVPDYRFGGEAKAVLPAHSEPATDLIEVAVDGAEEVLDARAG